MLNLRQYDVVPCWAEGEHFKEMLLDESQVQFLSQRHNRDREKLTLTNYRLQRILVTKIYYSKVQVKKE